MSSIAIIGTGISGLGAAFLLHPRHDITVYEKAAEIGGHTRTLSVNYDNKDIAVDTGFIVFNYRNYPHLSALFKFLEVPVQKSNMSFGVTANGGDLEWSAQNANGLFGQRRNFVRPAFYRFLFEVLRFNSQAVATVGSYPNITLGALLEKLKLSRWFSEYYLLPMGGAIWSCSLQSMLDFPARNFIDFFDAHGLLTVTKQPQWYTVTGGSKEYVKRLTAAFASRIRTKCGAAWITRGNGRVQVMDTEGEMREYDQVVLACHGDEALALLQDATPEERETLTAFRTQDNLAVLHRDESIMPKRRACWASWIYHAEKDAPKDRIAVTYWMNQLQGIDNDCPLFVTLNPLKPIAPELVFDTHRFAHPVYSMDAVAAQKRIASLQGMQNTWFCGAYLKNGFHEDGLSSAVDVATRIGVEIPWQ